MLEEAILDIEDMQDMFLEMVKLISTYVKIHLRPHPPDLFAASLVPMVVSPPSTLTQYSEAVPPPLPVDSHTPISTNSDVVKSQPLLNMYHMFPQALPVQQTINLQQSLHIPPYR